MLIGNVLLIFSGKLLFICKLRISAINERWVVIVKVWWITISSNLEIGMSVNKSKIIIIRKMEITVPNI